MPKIKFSHQYMKLAIQTECATLLQVFVTDAEELSKEFRDYDTAYFAEGGAKYYELPKGKVLVLVFEDSDNNYLFTTIRRWTPEKEQYYKNLQGETLEVEVTE